MFLDAGLYECYLYTIRSLNSSSCSRRLTRSMSQKHAQTAIYELVSSLLRQVAPLLLPPTGPVEREREGLRRASNQEAVPASAADMSAMQNKDSQPSFEQDSCSPAHMNSENSGRYSQVPRWSSSTLLEDEEEELPLHDQAFISFLPQGDDLDDVSVEEMQAARVLARDLSAPPPRAPERKLPGPLANTINATNTTQELSNGLRALLSESRFSRGRSSVGSVFDPFDDPTYTAELAQKEVLELLACDPHHEPGRRNSVQLKPLVRVGQRSARGVADAPAWTGGFEIFDEGDPDLGSS